MGSRWREMLMDYGQILGDKSSRSSNSAFFTVDGDLDEKRNEELQLRRVLEVHFRPIFQRFVYGGEKIACHDLRRILRDPEYRNRLPPDKVHELADLTDFNMGRAVKYEEFVRIVLGKQDDSSSSFGSQTGLSSSTSQLGRTFGIFRVVCRNTAQQIQVDETLIKYKCLPPPIFMIAISIAQIIVFIIHSHEDKISAGPINEVYSSDTIVSITGLNRAMYHPTRRHEAWRFLTYCFLHPGYVDLIFNVILQLVLGIPLEIIFSTWRMFIVYIVGVIIGSVGQSVIDHHVALTGAAGGAYAIVAGHLVVMWQERKQLNNDQTETKSKRILCSLTLRAILIFVILIPQVALAVYRRWHYTNDFDGRIGIIAHAGGLVAGIAVGPPLLKDNKRYPWKEGPAWMTFFFFLAFVGIGIIVNIVYRGYPAEDYS